MNNETCYVSIYVAIITVPCPSLSSSYRSVYLFLTPQCLLWLCYTCYQLIIIIGIDVGILVF